MHRLCVLASVVAVVGCGDVIVPAMGRDSGPGRDARTVMDAGASADAGPADAAAADGATDGGEPPDSGGLDAGVSSDSGPAVDAGDASADMDGGAGTDSGPADAGWDAGCPPAAPGRYAIDFDDAADGDPVGTRYVSDGLLLGTDVGEPVAFGLVQSTASPPNCLMGEYEGTDLNPGSEFGNNAAALPITLEFVSPGEPTVPAVTREVSLAAVHTNYGSVTRLEAYDTDGTMVDVDTVTTASPDEPVSLSVSSPAIRSARVFFGAAGSPGLEDLAGIDDLEYRNLTPVCP